MWFYIIGRDDKMGFLASTQNHNLTIERENCFWFELIPEHIEYIKTQLDKLMQEFMHPNN